MFVSFKFHVVIYFPEKICGAGVNLICFINNKRFALLFFES